MENSLQNIVIMSQDRMSAITVTHDDTLFFKMITRDISDEINSMSNKLKVLTHMNYFLGVSINNVDSEFDVSVPFLDADEEEYDDDTIYLGYYVTKENAKNALQKLMEDYIGVERKGIIYVMEDPLVKRAEEECNNE